MPETSPKPEPNILLAYAIFEASLKKAVRVGIDCGSQMTLIPMEVAFAIGLNPAHADKTTKIITVDGVVYAPLISIPSVQALGIEVKNLEVVCHNLPSESTVEGLLGLNFLIHFPPFLQFRDKVIDGSLRFGK